MTLVALVRHAATEWNAARRIQGRTDVPLSDAGRAHARAWRLPPELAGARPVVTSPLRRARETAALLGRGDGTAAAAIVVDPRLVEMAWGAWEGATVAALRARDPAGLAAREAAGLDFRPPGGESPREVRARVRSALLDLLGDPRPAVLVCHKGVIHAALSLATGWDYLGNPPVRLEPDAAVAFDLHPPDGRLELRGLLRLRGRGRGVDDEDGGDEAAA